PAHGLHTRPPRPGRRAIVAGPPARRADLVIAPSAASRVEWIAMSQTAPPQRSLPDLEDVERRVLDIVRDLAGEVGGPRAQRAAAPGASLERDLGLGSLERVELQLRLESTFGRTLDDSVLTLDTPAALAGALLAAGAAGVAPGPERSASLGTAAPAPGDAATVHEALWRRALAEPNRP